MWGQGEILLRGASVYGPKPLWAAFTKSKSSWYTLGKVKPTTPVAPT